MTSGQETPANAFHKLREWLGMPGQKGAGKKTWHKLILFVIWVALIAWGGYYIVHHADLAIIYSLPWSFWVLQAMILLVYLLLGSVLTVVVLRSLKAACPLLRVFCILQTSYSSSYLGPIKLGVPLRIFLFKQMLGVPYSKATSATILTQGIRLSILALVTALGIGIKFQEYYVQLLILIGAAIILLLVILVILRLARRANTQQKIPRRLREFLMSMYGAMKEVGIRAVIEAGLLSTILMLLMSYSSFFTLNQLGEHLAFFDVFLIDAISLFIGFVSFIPMGFGTRDATYILLLQQSKVPPEIAYSITIVQRMIWSLLPFAIGLISASVLGVRLLIKNSKVPLPTEEHT